MRNVYTFPSPKSYSPVLETIKSLLIGFAIGAVIMSLWFGGKAAGREEILKSDMWTDSNGTIYIDCLPETIAHENLAQKKY